MSHKTNKSVLEEIWIEKSFHMTIRKWKQQYFCSLIRTRKLFTHILEGCISSRSRGRSKQCWTDGIRDWTERMLTECTVMVNERRQWRALMHLSLVSNPQQCGWGEMGMSEAHSLICCSWNRHINITFSYEHFVNYVINKTSLFFLLLFCCIMVIYLFIFFGVEDFHYFFSVVFIFYFLVSE